MSDFFRNFGKCESYYLLTTEQRRSLENNFYKTNISDSQKQLAQKDSSFSIPGIDNSHSNNIIHKADSIIDNDSVVPFTAQLCSYHVINLQGGRPHFVIIGANDMVLLASMVVEFVLTLLLLSNILVSLMHTCSILII